MRTEPFKPITILKRFSLFVILIFLSIPCRADILRVYCDNWSGFCEKDGKGFYFDLVREIFQPHGYTIEPHIVPYKRASNIVNHNKGDMLLGVYQGELDNVLIPTYPDSADDLVVIMLRKWQTDWRGESSLTKQSVIWPRGWALEKYLPTPIYWHEVENDETAIELLKRERYRYYITVGALYPADKTPANIHREFLRWIPTYPAFSNDKRGEELRKIWDESMRNLINSGKLIEIYRHHHLYEHYQEFIDTLTKDEYNLTNPH